jgi:hypothetical protein
MHSAGEFYNPWRLFIGCIIPNAISRSTELSSTAKLVFGKLCQYAGQNGQAYPSYKTLAGDVGVERRQAIRAVKELVDYGLIKPVGRRKGDGGFTSNIYAFLWHQTFSDDGLTDPGDKNDTRGGVTNVTTPQCHKRHHLVSDMSPKENHTRESYSEKTTTEEIRLMLSGTPLSKISVKEVRILIKRHGSERVMQAADIAAETWRREHMEIRNPGGYLQAFCVDLVVPEWYEPPHVRAAKLEDAAERKRAEDDKQEDLKKAEALKSKERDDYWHSLSKEDQKKFIEDEKYSSPIGEFLPEIGVVALAKSKAWDRRSQMTTNIVSTIEPLP